MTSSHNREYAIEPLPPALSSMWRLCKLGYQHEPRLMLASLVLSQLAALPDALLALWLMLLGKGVLEHRAGLVVGAAVGLGTSAAATWFLRTVSTRVQRRFRDKVTIALESHVARLQASIATIAHQERPEYVDRLSMLRNQVFVLDHMYMAVFSMLGWILRLGVRSWLPFSRSFSCLPCLRCQRCGHLHGGRRSRDPLRRAEPKRVAWHAICSTLQRRPLPGKRCASPASETSWRRSGGRPGNVGTDGWRMPGGDLRSGTPWHGRFSGLRTSPPWYTYRRCFVDPPVKCCCCSRLVRGFRRILGQQWASLHSCVDSGWTDRDGWRG